MLRHAQHERILVNNFRTYTVCRELGRRTPNSFSTLCQLSTFAVSPQSILLQKGKLPLWTLLLKFGEKYQESRADPNPPLWVLSSLGYQSSKVNFDEIAWCY